MDNLKRLELIEIPVGLSIANESAYKLLEEDPEIKKIQNSFNSKSDKYIKWEFERKCFQLTQYGRDFVDVCVKD